MKFALTAARSGGQHRNHLALGLALLLAGGATGALAGIAQAGAPATLTTATSSALGETVVVDSHRVTVYELRPETAHHLLCMKAAHCFSVWPPLTVSSAHVKLTAGHGVSGRLGTIHRNGLYQVTLAGHPLYHFVGDGSRKGSASGQGIHSFGGTWHVVATSSAPASTPTTPTTPTYMTPTTPTTPTYITPTTTTTTPTTTTPTTPYYPPY